jgi:hypothetical protein
MKGGNYEWHEVLLMAQEEALIWQLTRSRHEIT